MILKRVSAGRFAFFLYLTCIAAFTCGVTWANCPSLVYGSQAEPYYDHDCLPGYGCGGYCCCVLLCVSEECSSQTQAQACSNPGICEWYAVQSCRGEICE